MLAQLIVVLSVLVLAFADPAKPTMPSQYMVTNINMVMDTNAGYPPHYTEEGTYVLSAICTAQSYSVHFHLFYPSQLTIAPPHTPITCHLIS